ncbi:hypothetical protein [Romboutsia sp.]|uniref:hypothetical protein n=1 Tax=Romboutsia sp. TaxID=1965302 RepID=UPI003F2C5E42
MNNINNNSYSKNLYEKLQIKPNSEIEQIQNKLIEEGTIPELPNEELIKLDKAQNEVVESFLNRIQQEIQKAQVIAIKMVEGNSITKEELEFISKKYPDIKQVAEQLIKKCDSLKLELRNCVTDEERQQILSNLIKEIKEIVKKGVNPEFQSKIKKIVLEEVIDFSKKVQEENKKAEIICLKIVKGEKCTAKEQVFISEKCPKLKQVAEKFTQEIKYIKEDLKNCKTEVERQKLVFNAINKIEENFKKENNFPLQVRIKTVAKEEIIKLSKQIELELKKVEIIGVKIIKGEKLTTKEQTFINEEYPNLRKITEQWTKEYKYIKKELNNCKTEEQKQQITYSKINELEDIIKEGTISEVHVKLKRIALEEVKKDYKNENNENEIKFNLNPYIYLNSKLLLDKGTAVIVIISVISILYILGKIIA